MKTKPNNLVVYVALIVIMLGICVVSIVSANINNRYVPNEELDDTYNFNEPKKANEYTVVNVSKGDVLKIYFNKFIETMMNSTRESYYMLNKEYREKKFKTYADYEEYVNKITKNKTEYPEYLGYKKVNEVDDLYLILDKNRNEYYFDVSGIMNFEVYFDNTLVKYK